MLGTSTTWIGSGLANGIPSTALIIHGKHYNTSTLPHEMGHCLGLYHTHHGTIYEEGSDDTNQCAEFVDGSNSSICGDYISDTPADPNRWSNNSCSYIGTGVDGHGDSYTPNASNYMSYAHKSCRTLFSDLQIDRMKLFINNTPSLQQVIDYNISGPSFVCDQATYTIQNLLPGAIVQWSVNNNNLQLLSGQGTGMATFKKSNIGRTNITAEIYNNNILISGVNQLVSVGVPELYTYGDYLYSGGQPKRCFVENQANSCYLQSDQDENIDKWDWRVTSGEIFVSGLKNENATIYPRPSSPPSFMIEIRALNKCGWTDWKRLLAYAVSSGACPFSLSPNPATDAVTLQLMETDEVSGLSVLSTDRSTYEIQLWSGMTMLRSFRTDEPTFQIPMAGLPAGLYFVRVIKDGQTYTQKLIKK